MRNYGGLRSDGGKERERFKRVLNKFLFPGIVGVLISVPVAAALLAYTMRTERRGDPVEIRITTMAEFHKSGSKEPFLWNCAATAARINRKAVYSADIILMGE